MEESIPGQNVGVKPESCMLSKVKEDASLVKANKNFPQKKLQMDCRVGCHTDSSVIPTEVNTIGIHSLPNEVLTYIFSFLSIKQKIQIELVCRRWRWIGKELPWAWADKLSLNLKQLRLTDDSLIAILSRCGRGLKNLELKRSCGITVRSGVSRRATEIVATYCPNLVDINFVGIGLPNFCLQILGQGCAKLKKVRFHESRGLCENGLSDFLKCCNELECLDVADTITGKCLGSVSRKLKILRLTCPTLERIALDNIMDRCQYLEELQLISSNFLDEGVLQRVLLKYHTTLKALHLDCYTVLQTVDWRSSVVILNNLELLSLNCCSVVDDKLLKTLSQNHLKLKHLSVQSTNISDVGLSYLREAPCLKIIDFSFNERIYGRGIEHLAGRGQLEEIYAKDVPSFEASFIPLATLCPNIHILDVGRNYLRISNKLVDAFCIGIRRGFLKGPVKLLVGLTSVTQSVTKCEGLELDYKPSPPWPIIGMHGTRQLQMPL